MKQFKKVFVIIILFAVLFSCGKENVKVTSSEINKIVASANSFGYKIFKTLIKEDKAKAENVFISPMSIYTALSMALNGAKQNTYKEMTTVLNVNDFNIKKVNALNKVLLEKLSGLNPEVKLKIANSLWINNTGNVKVREKFVSDCEDFFDAEVRKTRFNSSAVGDINAWVADKTDDMIKQLIDKLSERDKIVLLNAIFFHGIWEKQFKEKDTKNRTFTLADGRKIRHPLMYQKDRFLYSANTDYQALRLDYGENSKAGLIIILPKKGRDIYKIYDELNADALNQIPFRSSEGKIYIPKFKISYGVKSLVATLKKMGMKSAFSMSANFKNMITNKDVYISNVLHKAVIDLNEKGTKAAAATAVIMLEKSAPMPSDYFVFKANRPFLYFIRDNKTGLILFMGIMQNPA